MLHFLLMKSARLVFALLLTTAVSVPAFADVITTYDISFSGAGTLPDSASFTYDSTTPHFTDFTVNWNSFTFDMTGSANNPGSYGGTPACVGANTGAAAVFAILTTCSADGVAGWSGHQEALEVGFAFSANLTDCRDRGPCEYATDSMAGPFILFDVDGSGTFAITAVTAEAPEPASLWYGLSAAMLGLVAIRVQQRRKKSAASI